MSLRFSVRTKTLFLAFLLFAITSFCVGACELKPSGDLSGVVQNAGVNPENSALLIVRLEDGREWTSGGSRVEKAYSPASTAKIPHTLIALETRFIDGPNAQFKWDGEKRSPSVWNQDQTLSSAYKDSVVWVYQQIARSLGPEIMARWINRFEYGNRNIGTPDDVTTYWLSGPLKTSARDQVQFLSKVALETLPLANDTYRVGKSVMREEGADYWTFYGKTGFDGEIGWYVGWIQNRKNDRDHIYVFAFNMDIVNVSELPLRRAVVRSALMELGVRLLTSVPGT